jgi:hypothetical protein
MCAKCGDTGWMTLRRTDRVGVTDFALRCSCSGQDQPPDDLVRQPAQERELLPVLLVERPRREISAGARKFLDDCYDGDL